MLLKYIPYKILAISSNWISLSWIIINYFFKMLTVNV